MGYWTVNKAEVLEHERLDHEVPRKYTKEAKNGVRLKQWFVAFAVFRGFRVPMPFRADGGVSGLIIILLSSRTMNENISSKADVLQS